MTLRVIVDKFVCKINPYFPWSLTLAGFAAFAIAMISNPATEVSVAGGFMLAAIGAGFDHETRERHIGRFWESYRKARGERDMVG